MTKPPSDRTALALWLTAELQEGGIFTLQQFRQDTGRTSENLSRRLRELREAGWEIIGYKDDSTLAKSEYRLQRKGWNGKGNAPTKRVSISDSARRRILQRDKSRCVICGIGAGELYPDSQEPARLTVGHITPVAKGGTNLDSNLQTECSRCNEPARDQY